MYQAPARPALPALPPPPASPPGPQGVTSPCLPTPSGQSQGGVAHEEPTGRKGGSGGTGGGPLGGSLAGEGWAAWGKGETESWLPPGLGLSTSHVSSFALRTTSVIIPTLQRRKLRSHDSYTGALTLCGTRLWVKRCCGILFHLDSAFKTFFLIELPILKTSVTSFQKSRFLMEQTGSSGCPGSASLQGQSKCPSSSLPVWLRCPLALAHWSLGDKPQREPRRGNS